MARAEETRRLTGERPHATPGPMQPPKAPTSSRDMSDGSRPEQSPRLFCSCNAASEAKGDGCSAIACSSGRAQQKRTRYKRQTVSQRVPTQCRRPNSSAHKPPHISTESRRGTLAPNQPHRCTRRHPVTSPNATHTGDGSMMPERWAGAPIAQAPRRATRQALGLPRGPIRGHAVCFARDRTGRVTTDTAGEQPTPSITAPHSARPPHRAGRPQP